MARERSPGHVHVSLDSIEQPEVVVTARDVFAEPDNEIYLSVVTAWEISDGLGRLPLPTPPARFIPDRRNAYPLQSLALDEESALHVHRLPGLHHDPFDRMLICQ